MASVINHAVYLAFGVAFTVGVGRCLYRSGYAFLLDCLNGNQAVATAVNQMLLAGFYLMNTGLICVAIQVGDTGHTVQTSVENLGTRVGTTLLVMGWMHFQNLAIFVWIRSRRRAST